MGTLTASAKSVQYASPGIHTKEKFEAVLAAGIDEVFKREMANPTEGSQFFRDRTIGYDSVTFQGHYGLGVAPQNRDADDPVYDEKGLGFAQSFNTTIFRNFVKIEKSLKEDDRYGVVNDLQSELARSMKRTMEFVQADVFNRALGTSGAPILCEDGMYLIDSGRPNAFKPAGTWSNLETTSAITPDMIYNAQQNFASHKDEKGYPNPLTLRKVIIRPSDEKALWEIVKSELRPTDAMNARNYQYGRFEYSIYNYLTSAVILYLAGDPKSSENELEFVSRTSPEFWTGTGAENPDVIIQRVRARFGVGCRRPDIWRGGAVS